MFYVEFSLKGRIQYCTEQLHSETHRLPLYRAANSAFWLDGIGSCSRMNGYRRDCSTNVDIGQRGM